MKISGIYKITNLETNEYYIGSSTNIKKRWAQHKAPSAWKRYSNKKLYIDFQQYGLAKFSFEILEETENLKEREQYYIDLLKPVYNANRANGWDLERYKEYDKKYQKEYHKTDKYKEYQKQLCNYNGENLTLNALRLRFYKAGVPHPTLEAKKYIIKKS